VGKAFSAAWAVILVVLALFFNAYTRQTDAPVVVLALSIASVTYGGLLGTYILAAVSTRASGRDATIAIGVTVATMLVVIFARRLAPISGLGWLEPVGRLAWPWYVPLGTVLTLAGGGLASLVPHRSTATPR
jgi:hypothetical protein